MQGESSNGVKIYYPEYEVSELIERLRRGAAKANKLVELRLVVLFGSYSKGKQTASSDVDVFVVYRGSESEDPYGVLWDCLGVPELELHLYSEDEYKKMKQQNSEFLREALKGIVVWRAPDFELRTLIHCSL